jgi:hypothetical protein
MSVRIELADIERVSAIVLEATERETPEVWARRNGIDRGAIYALGEAFVEAMEDEAPLGLFCAAFQMGFEVAREFPAPPQVPDDGRLDDARGRSDG